MYSLEETIRLNLSTAKEEGVKRAVSLLLNETTIRRMDAHLKLYKQFTDGSFATSRNQLIEMALEQYLNASSRILLEDFGVNDEEWLEGEQDNKIKEEENMLQLQTQEAQQDTIVCSAQYHNYQNIFLSGNHWYSIRTAKWRHPHLKYIALYVGSPISGIVDYAKIDDFQKWTDGRWEVSLNGTPLPLPQGKLPLGNASIQDVRRLRYTNFQKLMSAKQVADLF
ncbi:hypothetical protein [Neobacillus sp. OS1-33]|uniref:hypothetical protein n=1 Tax=Neobacillus sp. OS1-33 TaxID=3070683 RepID=UPI0027E0B8DD|nr:hypothetical protein [Neobacillus sp. OS1-33]WML26305.1 hypothetical protein RCG22_01265 [Neobacillus sp. OS1-33]